MHDFLKDLRYGARMLAASPGFTLAAILCLALGIGATTAVYSIVHAVVLRPLGYAEPSQLVRIYTEWPTWSGPQPLTKFWVSPPEFQELKKDTQAFSAVEAWSVTARNVSGGNEPVRVTACSVTGGLLKTLGAQPTRGRIIEDKDDVYGGPPVALLSEGLWQRAFGGDPSIVGRDIQVNGLKTTVIGIMPTGFRYPPGEIDPPELWLPLQFNWPKGDRGNHFLSVIARMKPRLTVAQAKSDLDRMVAASGERSSQRMHVFDPKTHPLSIYGFQDEVIGGVRRAMILLLGAVIFVLLIGCVNVANLLLARAEARQREVAIRKALGASHARLAAQFITEGVLLSFLGGLLGVSLAYLGLRIILRAGRANIPRIDEIALDSNVLLFTLAVSIITGVLFGLAPIAQLVAGNLHDALKAASGRTTATAASNHFRRALVVGQLALALMLLIGTGLMVRAFYKLTQVNLGFDPDNVLTMRVALPQAQFKDGQAVTSFWNTLLPRLRTIPGVKSASLMNGLPPEREINANDTEIEGFVPREGGPQQNVDYWQFVYPGYFETMGIRLLEGRYFDQRDAEGSNYTVVVNKAMAETFWPGQSPIGRRLRPPAPKGEEAPWSTVVGVVDDAKNAGIDKPAGTELYFSIPQAAAFGGVRGSWVALRTNGDPKALASAVRGEIRQLDPSLPIASVRTMDEVIGEARSRPRFLTLLLSLFSAVALSLAAVGLYGVISYAVARRTSEFGIRMALGAGPKDVLSLVLKQGMTLGVIGIAVGLIGSVLLTRQMQSLLFGVSPFDPVAFAGMAAVLLAVMLIACYVPARRATRVNPTVALRYE
jgi:putative ABC transport system permease protein